MVNLRKKKICVIITSRTHYGRFKYILKELKENPLIDLQIIVAASAVLDKYGSILKEIEKDGFNTNVKLTMAVEGGSPISMAKTTGLGIIEFSSAFENLKPDIVLIRGDRFEILSATIAAAYMNILVAHIEGGEITGSIDESVRHAITKLSHIHFPISEKSKERIIKLGEDPQNVYLVGSPDIEFIKKISLLNGKDLFDKYGGVGTELNLKKDYLVVLQHPVTSEQEKGLSQIKETLYAIKELNIPTIWIWPNIDAGTDNISKGIRKFRELNKPKNIHFFRNLTPEDYIKIINNCSCLIGNSSSGIKESSYLGIPVVNIGSRQNGRERGENIIDSKYDKNMIKKSILKQLKNGRYNPGKLYPNLETSKLISQILSKCDVKIQKKINY